MILLCKPPRSPALDPVIGTGQPVAVIVCRYQETENPVFSSEDWAEVLNERVNAFYLAATRGKTSFDFQPVPGIFELPYTYESTRSGGRPLANDTGRIFTEARDAIQLALNEDPDVLEGRNRVVFFVNRPRRGVALPEYTFQLFRGALAEPVTVSCSMMSDPLAAFQISEVPGPDLDGDRLANAYEERLLTAPAVADSDGDGFDDGVEIALGMNPLEMDEKLVLPDYVLSTMIHELAHHLDLPDLYGDQGLGMDEHYESWGMLGVHNLQNFGAYAHTVTEWASGSQVETLTIPGNGLQPLTRVLSPPGEGGLLQYLRVRRPGFDDLLLEPRSGRGLDARRPSAGTSPRFTGLLGLPEYYREGVLITSVDRRVQSEGGAIRYSLGLPVSRVVHALSPECLEDGRIESRFSTFDLPGPALLEFQGLASTNAAFQLWNEEFLLWDSRFDDQTASVALQSGPQMVTLRHRKQTQRVEEAAFLVNLRVVRPTITAQPQSKIVLPGTSVTFSIEVSTPDATPVMFRLEKLIGGAFSGVPVQARTLGESAEFTFPAVTSSDEGLYRVAVMDRGAEVYSQHFELRISSDPLALALFSPEQEFTSSDVIHPWIPLTSGFGITHSHPAAPPAPYSVSTPLQGPVKLSFHWYCTNGVLNFYLGGASPVLSINSGEPARIETIILASGAHTARWEFVKAASNGSAVVRTPFALTRPPRILSEPRDLDIVRGRTNFLAVSWDRASVASVQWMKDGVPLPGEFAPFLTIEGARPEDAGVYSAQITGDPDLPPAVTRGAVVTVLDPHRPVEPMPGGPQRSPFNHLLWEGEGQEQCCAEAWRLDSRVFGMPSSVLPQTALFGAALPEGETFEDGLGLRITHLETSAEGAMTVEISSDPPPAVPDIGVVQGWLDSDENGFGTFLFGRGGEFNDPNYNGDFLSYRASSTWDCSVFPPVLRTAVFYDDFRLEFRVVNRGEGDAVNVTGRLYILPFLMPLGLNVNSHSALASAAFRSYPVSLGTIPAGGSAVASVGTWLTRAGSAVLLVDKPANEVNTGNNAMHFFYFRSLVAHGSPYPEFDVPLEIGNETPAHRYVAPLVLSLPPEPGFRVEILNSAGEDLLSHAGLNPGEAADFLVRIFSPEPSVLKPGQARLIDVLGCIERGDTFVSAGKVPIVLAYVNPARLSLAEKDLGGGERRLLGKLEYRPLEGGEAGPWLGVPQEEVGIEVVGHDGTRVMLSATTDAQGNYSTTFSGALEGVAYAATAHSAPLPDRDAADSETIAWGKASEELPRLIELDKAAVPENEREGTQVGRFSVLGGSEPFAFEFVRGYRDDDNRLFEIRDGVLNTSVVFDHEEESVRFIRVRATGARRQTVEASFEIAILDDTDEDGDGDGYTQLEEQEKFGGSDLSADTDRDGIGDAAELAAGSDPLDAASQPVSLWRKTDCIEFENPVSARCNPRDGRIYVLRQGTARDGLYRIEADGRAALVVEGKMPGALAIDPADGNLFFSERGAIFRTRFGASAREPWARPFPRDGVVLPGIDIAEPEDLPRLFRPGHGIALARGPGGESTIWEFQPSRAEDARLLAEARETISEVSAVAIGRHRLYVAGGSDRGAAIVSLGGEGILNPVPLDAGIERITGLVEDPLNQRLLLADGARGLVLEVDPATGGVRELLNGFARLRQGAIAIRPDGRELYVSDFGAGRICVFARTFDLPPEITGFEPDRVLAGGTAQVRGRAFASVSAVWVNGERVGFSIESPTRMNLALGAGTVSGLVTVRNAAGEAVSLHPLIIQHPPSAISLSSVRLPETARSGFVAGRFTAADPNPGEMHAYELLSPAEYPQNEFFSIRGSALVLEKDLEALAQPSLEIGVRASDPTGLHVTGTFEIEVAARPRILREPADVLAMLGGEAIFTVKAAGEGPLFYEWRFQGEPLAGASGASCAIQPVGMEDEGVYSVIVRNHVGAATSRSAALRLESSPVEAVIAHIRITNEGALRLTLQNAPIGSIWSLEASQDLLQWEEITRAVSEEGTAVAADPRGAAETRGFYRFRLIR